MADPLSIAAFACAGLHASVRAIVIISKAKSYNANIADAKLRTLLVLHSLTTWAIEAGLLESPPKLLINVHDAPIVPQILDHIQALFSNISELNTRYGSVFQPTDETIDENAIEDDDEKTLVPISGARSVLNKLRDVYSNKTQPLKRLRWVTIDDDKFSRLLERAKQYVSELEKYLQKAQQDMLKDRTEIILRLAVLNADEHQSSVISQEVNEGYSQAAVVAAARFKQMRLSVGMTDSVVASPANDTTIPESPQIQLGGRLNISYHRHSSRLRMRSLRLSRRVQYQPLRTLALYDGQTVLLEWKHVSSLKNKQIFRRVEQVAELLHTIAPSLHSLQCRGYVEDRENSRYGFVFNLPNDEQDFRLRRTMSLDANAGRVPDMEVTSLREMFNCPRPSLNTRLSIATTLLETLLNLHTAGWLHKELHSASVILVRKVDRAMHDDLELSTYTTYVAGYVSSRADGPNEMTETLQSEDEAKLYRHPSLLSDNRQAFQKSFDVFSVGCTLLEIGLWTSLRKVLEAHQDVEDEMPRALARHMSDPNVQPLYSMLDEKASPKVKPAPFDLMALKKQLLSSHLPNQHGTDTRFAALPADPRQKMMATLQAAMGKKYTALVEDLLAVSASAKGDTAEKDESVLELEMRARNVVQSIADAI